MMDNITKIIRTIAAMLLAALGIYAFGRSEGKRKSESIINEEILDNTLDNLELRKYEIKDPSIADDYLDSLSKPKDKLSGK